MSWATVPGARLGSTEGLHNPVIRSAVSMDSVSTESAPWLPDNADYVTRRRARGHCRAGATSAG